MIRCSIITKLLSQLTSFRTSYTSSAVMLDSNCSPPPKWPILCRVGRYTLLTHSRFVSKWQGGWPVTRMGGSVLSMNLCHNHQTCTVYHPGPVFPQQQPLASSTHSLLVPQMHKYFVCENPAVLPKPARKEHSPSKKSVVLQPMKAKITKNNSGFHQLKARVTLLQKFEMIDWFGFKGHF